MNVTYSIEDVFGIRPVSRCLLTRLTLKAIALQVHGKRSSAGSKLRLHMRVQ